MRRKSNTVITMLSMANELVTPQEIIDIIENDGKVSVKFNIRKINGKKAVMEEYVLIVERNNVVNTNNGFSCSKATFLQSNYHKLVTGRYIGSKADAEIVKLLEAPKENKYAKIKQKQLFDKNKYTFNNCNFNIHYH